MEITDYEYGRRLQNLTVFAKNILRPGHIVSKRDCFEMNIAIEQILQLLGEMYCTLEHKEVKENDSSRT